MGNGERMDRPFILTNGLERSAGYWGGVDGKKLTV